MRYLLDTCAVSDFAKGNANVVSRLKATSPAQIAVSMITRMEIEYGFALNPERAKRLAGVLDVFFDVVAVLPFENDDARATAALRAALATRGTPIGAYDALVAGTALARGLIVVTSNTGEFSRVGGLILEDWRLGAR